MNRSSTPKGAAPVIKKPVHIPNRGVAEAPSAFLRDDKTPLPKAMKNMPMSYKNPHLYLFQTVFISPLKAHPIAIRMKNT